MNKKLVGITNGGHKVFVDEQPKAVKVTQEHIDNLLANSKVDARTVFEKCMVVTVQLPNGYTLTESSGCVDPANYDANYDAKYGKELCMEQIKHRLWQLEGYVLQSKVSE
ncbi:Gp49 family protein [Nicoliella lavandulae]|uniref:Gp49 family protein n=1 Tax=Nicoliella lavandulae TaxID=3082954 RepID=A0ABU8SMB5_9LACO